MSKRFYCGAKPVARFGLSCQHPVQICKKQVRKLRDFDILPDNKLCDYSKPYAAIAMANAVIKYASDVVEKDPSFDRNMCRSFMAEAFFQRSLAYFYLVRTFKDTPFVVEPYVDDSAPYVMGKTDGTTILKSCISDLETYLPNAKEFFPEVDNDDPINTKGRATQWGIHALLAICICGWVIMIIVFHIVILSLVPVESV